MTAGRLENGIISQNHLNVWKSYENLDFPSPLYFFPWMKAWGNHLKTLPQKKKAEALEAWSLAMQSASTLVVIVEKLRKH